MTGEGEGDQGRGREGGDRLHAPQTSHNPANLQERYIQAQPARGGGGGEEGM